MKSRFQNLPFKFQLAALQRGQRAHVALVLPRRAAAHPRRPPAADGNHPRWGLTVCPQCTRHTSR
jgi:hypothetical protein